MRLKVFILLSILFLTPTLTEAALVNRSAAGPRDGLVGHWTFDGRDIVNGVVRDISGQGNHGNPISIASSTFYTRGKIGQAIDLDGIDDRVNISHDSSLAPSEVSIAFWMYPTSDGTSLRIIDKGTNAYIVRRLSNNRIEFVPGFYNSANTVTTINTWTHVVTTAGSAGHKIFLNGVEVLSNGTAYSPSGTGSLSIGGTLDRFEGKLDDIRIYNRTLSASEIRALYNIGSGGKLGLTSRNANTSGLVGHWTFDGKDMANGVAIDVSGNGNHGNPLNIATSTFYTKGRIGQGIHLDGSDDRINIPAASSINDLPAMSVSFWAKPTTLGTNRPFVAKADNSSGGHGWRVTTDTSVSSRFRFHVDGFTGTDLAVVSGDDAFSAGELAYYTVTWDGTNQAATGVKLYKNGEELSYTAQINGGSETPQTDAGRPLTIGREVGVGTNFVHGLVDDVRLYNRALSATEVRQIYNESAGKFNITPTDPLKSGLVGHWTFDGKDMPNGVARDVSGQGNHGNLINIATSTFYARGKIGQGAGFDGNNYISLKNSISQDNPMTVCSWVNSSNLSGMSPSYGGGIVRGFMNTNGAAGDFWLGVNNSGLVVFTYYSTAADSTGLAKFSDPSITISPGKWYHICATWNGSTRNAFINGVNQGTGTLSDPGGSWGVGNYIGRIYPALTYSFQGKIDDVRVYNRVLSAAELTALYNLGI